MQQLKYPSFDDIKYYQQYSQDQDFQQQLISKTNNNIKYIPVLISQQPIIYQQPQVQQQYPQYQQHYILPQPEQQNLNFNLNPEASDLLKDQDFQNQKVFLGLILGVYILWSILFVLLIRPLIFQIIQYNLEGNQISLSLAILLVFSLTTIILAKFGIARNNRSTATSLIILFGLVLSYSLFYLTLIQTLDSFLYTETYEWVYQFEAIMAYSILGNFIFNIIVIIYLMFAETELNMFFPNITQFLISLILAIQYDSIFYYCIFTTQIYAFCLINVLKQIIIGRFQLKKNQVFVGVIAAFYGQIDCFTD
ncbi:unnamed protein product [Paramecium primaurelia]|uniref:Transmembrane protein n=1 Tax=Paramecium primaurelia TaxID=5886 RepID=A0A8S1PD23_PARPR|nr:unnamed protein product [Paramecium primaurelia]